MGLNESRSGVSLEAKDEAAGECLRVSAVGGVVDAVAEVRDTPIDVGKDGGVETDHVSVGEVVGIFEAGCGSAVGGDAEDEFAVGFDGDGREFYCGSRADKAALDVAGEITARVHREVDGAGMEDAVVEADGTGEGPVLIWESTFFATASAVDREPSLGVKGDGVEAKQE